MSVLMTADNLGGVWTHALDLVRGLAPLGAEVSLAVMGDPLTEEQRAELERTPLRSWHALDCRLEWMPEPWDDVDRSGEWLRDVAAEVRPDLVHVNGYAHAAPGWRAPVVLGAHSCVVSWWRAVKGHVPGDLAEYSRRVTEGLHAADAVVAPTRWMLESLTESYGWSGRGAVVPNGRGGTFTPRPKEPLVVTIGRVWDDAKNVAALDAVAGDVPCELVVVGSGVHPASGAQTAAHHAGRMPPHEIAELLGRAAIFAEPARYEPFGLAALEAGLAGCALVLGDIPSLREVWGDAAVFVAPDDHAALRDALARLASDPAECTSWGDRARERATGYTLDRMAAGYDALYRSVAREPVAP
ncbi:MAG TPA: glycosyltransferase family 4 protein [Actinomycetota bacterium]|nr:glycosyltransferase family 4 protein [Actinomycetota bacterium]